MYSALTDNVVILAGASELHHQGQPQRCDAVAAFAAVRAATTAAHSHA
jgi:hypothetical protein